MQKTRQNMPKTIQMRYPVSYSQTWNKRNTPPTSPRLGKKRSRLNSHSAQLDADRNTKIRTRTVSSKPSQPIPNRRPYRRAPPVRRPDPSAPHLKYGLFTNPRKPFVIGGLPNAISPKPVKKKFESTESSLRTLKEREKKPEKEPEEQREDAPLLVFRPISKHYTQKLSNSSIYHLDIKPGKRITSSQQPKITIM